MFFKKIFNRFIAENHNLLAIYSQFIYIQLILSTKHRNLLKRFFS